MLDLEDAQTRSLGLANPLPLVRVAPDNACGKVLFEPVRAAYSLPQADLSVMDGWAVRSGDLSGTKPTTLRRSGESAAGHPPRGALGPGEAMRIFTGAVLPEGADAVIPQEDATEADGGVAFDPADTGPVQPGKFVRAAGSELEADDILLPAGTLLRAGDVALLAAAGVHSIPVHRPPNVAILSTGDELVPAGVEPRAGQVVSTNGQMLADLVRSAGGIPVVLGDVNDEPKTLRRALERGLEYDVLVTTGGVSVGDHDLVHGTLAELGCRFAVERVRVRPGKPVKVGAVERALVFGLPGNPASAFVSFELFVRPSLRRLLGHTDAATRPTRRVTLAAPVAGAGQRVHMVRVTLDAEGRAQPGSSQGSGNLRSISRADALVPVPAGVERLDAGTVVTALLLDGAPP